MRALLLLLLCAPAFGQSALPNLTPDVPGAPHYLFTKNGQCIWWYVYHEEFTDKHPGGVEFVVYCGTAAQLPNVGARANTIRNAVDPLKSLQTLPKRITMSRLVCQGLACASADPALTPIVADLNAARLLTLAP